MNAVKSLGKKYGWKRVEFSEDEIRGLRRDLENKTEEPFREIARAKRESWACARNYVLGVYLNGDAY
jgi:hypothetical protein